METWFYYKMEFMCLCKMSANHKVLCKSLQPPLFSLCFARKMGNECSDLLKCANLNGNVA